MRKIIIVAAIAVLAPGIVAAGSGTAATGTRTETKTGTGTRTETKTGTGTRTETKTGTGTRTETKTGTGIRTGTGTEAGIGIKTGTGDGGPVRESVYVFNLYGAEEGRADQRPANLVASEFSSLRELNWSTWGPEKAVGRGRLSGTWCLPGCLAEPYTATITLGAVRKVRGKKYFTRFGIDGDFPKPEEPADTLVGTLPTP
ncbi:hypothetical protein ACQPYK_04370 [Streptosporangium sp. CA-135522]|uniref:hypothetical protein n=1 Tax=Streptosporangium sp. CA-135522 TaxID=3240072 RepID=UPI003D901BD8